MLILLESGANLLLCVLSLLESCFSAAKFVSFTHSPGKGYQMYSEKLLSNSWAFVGNVSTWFANALFSCFPLELVVVAVVVVSGGLAMLEVCRIFLLCSARTSILELLSFFVS